MSHHAAACRPDSKEVLTWEGFGLAIKELAQQVRQSGFRPSVIIAIARGGLVPAGVLTYHLDVQLADAINVEFYTNAQHTVPDPVLLAPMLDAESIAGQQLLVVDDIADTGHTLGHVVKLLRGFGAQVRSAVLYTKPATVVEPDYRWRCTPGWVVFPWEDESCEI